mgnify:CR=1 FL=1
MHLPLRPIFRQSHPNFINVRTAYASEIWAQLTKNLLTKSSTKRFREYIRACLKNSLRRGIRNEKEKMEQAAQALYNKYETAVLCKGGHSIEDANDYLYGADGGNWLESKRIDNENTHGTGCTLSSAIASYLAQNCELTDAVIKAKEYISGALADGMDLGQGSGPLNHAFRFNPSKN